MKRAAALLLVLLAGLFCSARSFGAIQEVADNDGNVTHYKYTDSNGSVVFTDSLAKIPEEYRKKNKVVRVGPPKKAKPPVEKAAPETAPPPETPALPVFQVKPEAPPPGESSGGFFWLIVAAAAIGAGVVGFVVYRRASGDGKVPTRKQGNGLTGKDRAVDPAREHKRPHEFPGPAGRFRDETDPGRIRKMS